MLKLLGKKKPTRLVFEATKGAGDGITIGLSKDAQQKMKEILATKGCIIEFHQVPVVQFAAEEIDSIPCHECVVEKAKLPKKAKYLLHYSSSVGYTGYIPVCEKHFASKNSLKLQTTKEGEKRGTNNINKNTKRSR